ncbi:MAG: hypothetical protein KatS3mg057_1026 [Herpetosiphonaceae bacterium]|nr:MAG: hypothetical protein KatS3mg057_1026 [Herpetosiphonaceae bacterium]
MNLRAGLELIRRTLFGWMAGRGFFWTLAFGWMVPSLVYLFVWITLAEQRAIGGFERHEFIQYYLVLIIVNQLTYPVSNWTVGDVIRSGGFATWLLRPMAPIYEAIAGDIGDEDGLYAVCARSYGDHRSGTTACMVVYARIDPIVPSNIVADTSTALPDGLYTCAAGAVGAAV